MKPGRYVLRSLMHYRQSNLAVIAGVAIAVSVLSGALLVGSSVRESLRALVFQRLGRTVVVVSSDHFFSEKLADELQPYGPLFGCPVIALPGIMVHELSGTRVRGVNVTGADDRFWKMQGVSATGPQGRTAMIGAPLASKLGVKPGDALLLRIETQQGIPKESLFGRRENTGKTLRLTCGSILDARQLGEFSLQPGQQSSYAVFVPLTLLQRDLGQSARVNAALFASTDERISASEIRTLLQSKFTLEDAGLRLSPLGSRAGLKVESSRIILEESVVTAAFGAAQELHLPASGILTYLANSIRVGDREIPYSVITAADLGMSYPPDGTFSLAAPESSPIQRMGPAAMPIWLNQWAMRDLGAAQGQEVDIKYYEWLEEGRLITRDARFRLEGEVKIGGDVDGSLAPDFPGITDARSMSSWDPPFPLDLNRIRKRDEDYWDKYRATPKAFVPLAVGQKLWGSRFGSISSIRISLPGNFSNTVLEKFATSLRSRLEPEQVGFSVNDVRNAGMIASRGSTDLGEYFVYFSTFLIASALLLSSLFFRLGIERRLREIGVLRAAGFSIRDLRRIFLTEAGILATAGALAGVAGSALYGSWMVASLRVSLGETSGLSGLQLHLGWRELAIGAGAGIVASILAAALTLRGFRQTSPRALVSGELESTGTRARRKWVFSGVALFSLCAAGILLAGAAMHRVPALPGFFGAGSLLLICFSSLVAFQLRRKPVGISGRGFPAWLRLGARNAAHRPGRSLSCITLIASATFIVVSVEAFRKDPSTISFDQKSGTGGYAVFAQSVLPVVQNPNTPEGREAMALDDPGFAQIRFQPFRLRPGDDASCLNPYAPRNPRILAASDAFMAADRFSFQGSLHSTPEEERNPWTLLNSRSADGSIPAIGDANTIQYILQRNLGDELIVPGSKGTPVRLRIVAALRDTIFQGELLISESNFLRIFPEQEGYRFFLADWPGRDSNELARLLETKLADWGVEAGSTRDRLARYHQVENTYLSTFQMLGTLGLILGTAGLAAVLLRNVLERRKELALLRAAGFCRRALQIIILAENLFLIACGLAGGTVCALIAVAPAIRERGVGFPLTLLALLPAGVLAMGLASSLLALYAALRTPLLVSLRSE